MTVYFDQNPIPAKTPQRYQWEAQGCESLIGQWGDAEISAYLTKLDELTTEGIPLQQAERLAGQFVDSRQHQHKF
jgi:hypothetical protein